jgi:hypothetical protein
MPFWEKDSSFGPKQKKEIQNGGIQKKYPENLGRSEQSQPF